ncbi:copper chaperone PCu(A)C [Loktanella agnita]|uniref:copper chaperone PCu(A)C n=1 Tax=Loktanella agnita TaxID=287097 RepID=UPI003986551A
MNVVLKILAATALSILGFVAAAMAEEQTVVVEDAWSRASVGVNRPGAVYMTVRNIGEDTAILTGLRTDLAKMPEIHLASTNDQGVSSMTPAGDIEIAPGEAAALEPGGLHAMLMRLSRPMVEGEAFALTLTFADGDEFTVDVPILGVAARGPES